MKLQTAFWTRLQPDGTRRHRPEQLGQRLIEKRARIRDDLSKQVASGIVRQALDHGCHVIVIEDLDHYKTTKRNDPAQNRTLRIWGKQQVRNHLEDLCELHGLTLKPVNPAWTSWHDARTDRIGVRLDAVAFSELKDPNHWRGRRWKLWCEDARKATKAGKYLTAFHKAVSETEQTLAGLQPAQGTLVLVPWKLGPGFGSEDVPLGHPIPFRDDREPDWPPGIIDADANAAANIALRFFPR